jgi:hypothetical protein
MPRLLRRDAPAARCYHCNISSHHRTQEREHHGAMSDTFDNFDAAPEDASSTLMIIERVPRFRLLKLAGGLLVLLPVLVVVTWFFWNWQARARFDAFVEKHRALGQPVLIEDFQTEPVPDERNAAPLLIRAAEIVAEPAEGATRNWLRDVELTDIAANAEEVGAFIAARAAAFDLVAAALQRPEAEWGVEIKRPVFDIALTHVRGQRDLGRFLWLAARHAHVTGDHHRALLHIRQLANVAARVNDGAATLIGHVVRLALEGAAFGAVEELAADLTIEPGSASAQANELNAASRTTVRDLIAVARDEAGLRASWQQAMYSERLTQLDMALRLAQGPVPGVLTSLGTADAPTRSVPPMKLLAPIVLNDMRWAAGQLSDIARAGGAASYPAAPWIPERLESSTVLDVTTHTFSAILLPSLKRAAELHFRAIAVRRMAAIRLAVCLYELDHGHQPEELPALVPAYLDEIPPDPFAADDRPIGYAPDADPPVLYSIGADGVDHSGRFEFKSNGSVDYDAFDIPFFLDGAPPKPPVD